MIIYKNNDEQFTKDDISCRNVLRAVDYTRFSSVMQKIESIEAQRKAIDIYAGANNMQIVASYSDQGISGTKADGRLEFQRMIRDAEKGLFDVVLVHKVDRFARNVEEYLMYEKILNSYGVELIAVNSPFDNTPLGKAAKMLLIIFAEMFSENLSNEVKTKMEAHIAKGRILQGGCYGYKRVKVNEETELEVVDKEAEVVRYIFEQYALGTGMKAICDNLNERGIRTRKGKHFYPNTIASMLSNETYVGNYTFNKHRKDKKTSKRYVVHNDEQVIRLEGRVPQIISIDVWNAVQTRLNESSDVAKRKTKKGNRHYLLTGKCLCGECKGNATGTSKGSGYYYYSCSRRNQLYDRSCKGKAVNAVKLEEKVIDTIYNLILTDDFITDLSGKIKKAVDNMYDDGKKREKLLEKDIAKLKSREKKLLDLYYDDALSAQEFKSQKADIQSQLEYYEQQKYNLQSESSNINTKMITNFLHSMKKKKDVSIEAKQAIVNTLVESVVITDTASINLYLYKAPDHRELEKNHIGAKSQRSVVIHSLPLITKLVDGSIILTIEL